MSMKIHSYRQNNYNLCNNYQLSKASRLAQDCYVAFKADSSEVVNSKYTSIETDSKNIDISGLFGHVKSKSGNIDIADDSMVYSYVSTDSGEINLTTGTAVQNYVSTESGNINLTDRVSVSNYIKSKTGNITVVNAIVTGDIETNNKITLNNSTCWGTITAYTDKLELNGKNKIGNVKIKDKKGFFAIKSVEPKFIVPAGTTVEGSIIFDTKLPGKVVIEDGASLKGKIVNGMCNHYFPRNTEVLVEILAHMISSADKKK